MSGNIPEVIFLLDRLQWIQQLCQKFYIYEIYTFSVFVGVVKKGDNSAVFIIEVIVGDSGVIGCIILTGVSNILSTQLTYMRG